MDETSVILKSTTIKIKSKKKVKPNVNKADLTAEKPPILIRYYQIIHLSFTSKFWMKIHLEIINDMKQWKMINKIMAPLVTNIK